MDLIILVVRLVKRRQVLGQVMVGLEEGQDHGRGWRPRL